MGTMPRQGLWLAQTPQVFRRDWLLDAYARRGEYARAVEDCEVVLRLNPYHFGAAAGLGQCLLKLKKARAALRAFRQALDLNPALEHLKDTIQALEEALDNGSRDD